MKVKVKEANEVKGSRLAVTLWGVMLLLVVGFVCGGSSALMAQVVFSARSTPPPTITPTAVMQIVTATPSPTLVPSPPTIVEENLRDNPIYGIGHIMQVRANWRITAVGVAYLNNEGGWVERVYCDPLPADYLCEFPRPPLNEATMGSFSIMVRETDENAAVAAGQWHYLKANASKDITHIEWGIEGNVYRYWADPYWP